MLAVLGLALALGGCLKQPDKFAPPEQRDPQVLDEDRARLHYVPMGAEEAPAHLMKALPQEKWIQFSHQIIHFGREICVARKPKCGICPMNEYCYAKDRVPV